MALYPTRRSVLAGTAAAALAGAGTVRADAPRRLVIALTVGPTVLEPVLLNHTALYRVASNLFDSLIGYDYRANMKLRPALAERWERVDDRSLRLWLRQGVRFHDGSPMTAEDVVFSLGPQHLLGPDQAGQVVSMQTLGTLDAVHVEAPDRVVVSSKGPDVLLEQRLAAWPSQIVSRRAFEAAGSWRAWQNAPIGTGPYKLAETKTDIRVVLQRHDAYWGGTAPYDSIEWRVVPELSSRVAGLLAGDYHLITDVPPDQFAQINGRPGLEVVGGPIQNIRFLAIDTTAPVLQDVRVRRALSLAIDRKLIVDSLWSGRTALPNGFQMKSFGATWIEDFPVPAFDPDQARKLLRAAGYNGEPIHYRLLNNYYPLQVAGAQAMVEMWRAVGLNVVIEMKENVGQIEATPIQAIFDNSCTALLPDHLGQAWRVFGTGGEAVVREKIWQNDEYEALGRVLAGTTDVAERRRAHRRMLEILANDAAPCVILHQQAIFYAKRQELPWRPYETLITDFGPFNATA